VELSQAQLEEYKLCQEKANSLGDNLWKTASIFGIGSIVGIISLSNKKSVLFEFNPWLSIILGLFAVSALLTWYRFASRWLSIQEVVLRRMEHIERESQLRTNLYVGYLDAKNVSDVGSTADNPEPRVQFEADETIASVSKPFLQSALIRDLEGIKYNYRGIKPMINFFVICNIAVWVVFIIFKFSSIFSSLEAYICQSIITILFTIGFFILLLYQWRKW
jgi:hypothetical protein